MWIVSNSKLEKCTEECSTTDQPRINIVFSIPHRIFYRGGKSNSFNCSYCEWKKSARSVRRELRVSLSTGWRLFRSLVLPYKLTNSSLWSSGFPAYWARDKMMDEDKKGVNKKMAEAIVCSIMCTIGGCLRYTPLLEFLRPSSLALVSIQL